MTAELLDGDALEVLRTLASGSVQTVVTSPPYFGLRDYGHAEQVGLEGTPAEYVERLVSIFREVRRVLRDDGTVWLNLGDSYASSPRGNKEPGGGNLTNSNIGSPVEDARWKGARSGLDKRTFPGIKQKDLIGIPWRVAFALQADGWYLRSDIIWHKPNPMPESVTDRPTKSHEYIFLLTKGQRYHYDHEAIAEQSSGVTGGNFSDKAHAARLAAQSGGTRMDRRPDDNGTRNKRSVWTVATQPYPEAHFATYPPELIRPCILAGCPEGGTVLDPFSGSGTTGLVALQHGRCYIGIELNPEYQALARARLAPLLAQPSMFGQVA